MKILHVIPSLGPQRGGPSQAALDLVAALTQAGADVTLVATNDNGPGILDVPLGKTIDHHGAPTLFFPRFSPPVGAVADFAFSASLTRWLWHHMARYAVVHVHALFSYASTVAMTIARLRRVPYVNRPLGILNTWSMQQQARKKQAYLTLIERANLNHASALHFTADQEAAEAAALHLRPPGVVIPNILPTSPPVADAHRRLRQTLGLPADEPVILFLSRLHPKKGLDYLIPALAQLADRRFTLILAGQGAPDYTAHLRALIQDAGLQARTHWAGFVQGERKALLVAGADLLALTSHSENFGIVVLEALAAGTPVLVTPGVALAPVVARHRLGFTPDLDVAAIAAALRACLADLPAARALGAHGRAYVTAHYSPATVAQQLIQVYNAILNHQPLPFVVPPPP